VNVAFLRHLLSGGYLPVISPVSANGTADSGGALNVNGDDAAAALAVALGATELLLVADVPGVLCDGEVATVLTPDSAAQMLADGTAGGGMRAKLQAAISALDGGVERVRISDLDAISDPDRGTTMLRAGALT
jgi:acetylglutamate kinase